MSDEHRTGYESGSFQESTPAKTQTYQGGGNYNGGNRGGWSNPHGKTSGGQSGGVSRFSGGGRRSSNGPPRDFNLDPPILYKPYFVASNDQPPIPGDIIQKLTILRDVLGKNEFTVRTACMNATDMLFAEAKHKELILPFREWKNPLTGVPLESKFTWTSEEAKFLAKRFAPQWDTITKDVVKTFLAKNIRLATGTNTMSTVMFGIIYTVDGAELSAQCTRETGNCRHIVDICDALRVPIFNFAKPDALDRVFKHLRIDPNAA